MEYDCRELPIKTLNKSKRINIAVISLIGLAMIAIIASFVRDRADQRHSPATPPPKNPEATLTINQFHHEAMENGEKKWTLEAASASLFASQNKAHLTDILVVFSMKKGENLTIRADEGDLDTRTNDLRISGNIKAEIPPYSLTTESLNYLHSSRMIKINAPVKIAGRAMALKAGSLEYNITTDVLTCENHVDASFTEIIK